jgi:hypothetical protein
MESNCISKGAMNRFVIKKTQVSSDNQSVKLSTLALDFLFLRNALDIVSYNDPTDGQKTQNNVEVEKDHIEEDHADDFFTA